MEDEKPKRTRKTGYMYKGGIEFQGVVYPSKTELWRQKGTTSLPTFRFRIQKGMTLEQALGVHERT